MGRLENQIKLAIMCLNVWDLFEDILRRLVALVKMHARTPPVTMRARA